MEMKFTQSGVNDFSVRHEKRSCVSTCTRGEKKGKQLNRRLFDCENERCPADWTPICQCQLVKPLTERQQMSLAMKMSSGGFSTTGLRFVEETGKREEERNRRKSVVGIKGFRRNARGETALHVAAIRGDIKKTSRLVRIGVPVDSVDFAGWTPLHESCNRGWLRIADILIKSGANVNAKGFGDDTPLHDAAVNGHAQIVQLLLDHGAVVTAINSRGRTPFDVAASNEISQLLKDSQDIAASSRNYGPTEKLTFTNTLTNTRQGDSPLPNTMPKNSPQHQMSKGFEKPSSPRLTLRFQPIRSREDKHVAGFKPTEVSSSDPRYQSYCVTMESAEEAVPQGPECPEPQTNPETMNEAQMNAVSSSTASVTTGNQPVGNPQPEPETKDKSAPESGNHPEDSTAVEPEDGRRKRRKECRDVTESGPGLAMSLRNHGKSTSSGSNGGTVETADKDQTVSSVDMDVGTVGASGEESGASQAQGSGTGGQNLPKVPPLKIVLPPPEQEKGKSSSRHQALPYVVSSSPPESSDQKEDIGARVEDGKPGSGTTSEERSQRVTRSRAALASASSTSGCTSGGGSESSPGHDGSAPRAVSRMEDDESGTPASEVHPRKRKLRPKESSSPEGSGNSSSASVAQSEEQPVLNGYEMYLNIRKQIDRRRKGMFVVQPKPPEGFKDYLMNRCSYVLAGNSASRLSVPMIPPPQSLTGSMRDLFVSQEKERYRLRLQHIIEKDKLMLSVEQEIVRVYGNAARAVANQNVPLSVCSILKDEEVYNHVEPEQEEKERNTARTRYTGRLLLSWLQDVDDKWEKIKEAMLLRHHNEAESLHAVQKLDWEWKMKELGICDSKSSPVVDDIHVPMVHIKPMHVQAALHRSGHRKGKY